MRLPVAYVKTVQGPRPASCRSERMDNSAVRCSAPREAETMACPAAIRRVVYEGAEKRHRIPKDDENIQLEAIHALRERFVLMAAVHRPGRVRRDKGYLFNVPAGPMEGHVRLFWGFFYFSLFFWAPPS